jgi:hypothetical protein
MIDKKDKKYLISMSDKLHKLLIKTGDDMNILLKPYDMIEFMELPEFIFYTKINVL